MLVKLLLVALVSMVLFMLIPIAMILRDEYKYSKEEKDNGI